MKRSVTILLWDDAHLLLGVDFADAVIGAPASRGEVQIGGKRYAWQSTLSVAESETALRRAAAREGKRVEWIETQAA